MDFLYSVLRCMSGDIHCRIVDSSYGMFTNWSGLFGGSPCYLCSYLPCHSTVDKSLTEAYLIHNLALCLHLYHPERWSCSNITSHVQIDQLATGINTHLSTLWLSARFHPTSSPQITDGTRLRQQHRAHCSTSCDIFVITEPVPKPTVSRR